MDIWQLEEWINRILDEGDIDEQKRSAYLNALKSIKECKEVLNAKGDAGDRHAKGLQ